jgi:hypothetical protein
MKIENNNNSITVFRRQVIQTGDYEPAEASCSVTIPMDADASMEDVGKEIAKWGTTLEIANYEALGVGYELDEQGVRLLNKSVRKNAPANPVAAPSSGNKSYSNANSNKEGGSLQDVWRDLMDNQNMWWPPNWQDKLNPDKDVNANGPDYKRKADGKGVWLSKKDGTPLIPDWFVCPFTAKDAEALKGVAREVRA